MSDDFIDIGDDWQNIFPEEANSKSFGKSQTIIVGVLLVSGLIIVVIALLNKWKRQKEDEMSS